jgi:hypothetical protein
MTRKDFMLIADVLVKAYKQPEIQDGQINKMANLFIYELQDVYPNFDTELFRAYIIKQLELQQVS